MAIKKAENIDPYKIEGTFKHGGYTHFEKKDYIVLLCFSLLVLSLGSIIFFFNLFAAIIVEGAFLLVILGLLFYMLCNLRIWKDIKKWLPDAVELVVIPEYLDGDPAGVGLSALYASLLPEDVAVKKNLMNSSIQVRFRLNGRWHCLWSKRMPAWNKYVGRETTILYSEKYNEVIVMKQQILSEE